MHSFTPMPAKKRHRHIVVAPVFVLVLLMTLQLGANATLTGSIAADADAPSSGLILAEGPTTVAWKNVKITGWAGAFHLTAAENMTVSAITTPVLVEAAPRAAMLVPIGMQWRIPETLPAIETSDLGVWIASRKLLPLPEAFLIEQIKAADALKDALPRTMPSTTITPLDEFFQLPAARERAEAARRTSALDPLEAALRSGDVPASQALLASADVIAALQTEGSRVPRLLGIAALNDVPVQTTLMPLLEGREDQWLLASIHPAFEGAHWLLDEGAETSPEAQFLRLWMFPIADYRANAFVSTSVPAWGRMLGERLYGQKDPSAEAVLFLKVANAIVLNHHSSDRPERAKRYAKAAYEALKPFETLFTDEGKLQLESLNDDDEYLLEKPEESSVSSASAASAIQSTSSAMSILHPDEVAARTRAALSAVGIMFTKDTFVDPEGNQARVRNAVMATPTGDRYYDFLYDVLKNEVGSIVDNGTTYPYALPLERFVEWVRTGE